MAYAPIPDRTLVAIVTDEAYRSAYLRAEVSDDDGTDNQNVPFVGGQWHHVCMAFEAAKADILFLKHACSILRHSSNSVCGFSMMEQVLLCALWPTENWLCSSINHIQGWMTV